MKVFREHRSEFIDISLKKDKLKTMLHNQRFFQQEYGKKCFPDKKIEELKTEIKEGIEKLNKIIGKYLK